MPTILRDVSSLYPLFPQRTGMANAEELAGPELGSAERIHLRRYFSVADFLDSVQRTTTRIDSATLMNHLEAGVLERPGPCR